jgi:8-oxo-dGTP pyrophosphatase MutT (NUDIX family)
MQRNKLDIILLTKFLEKALKEKLPGMFAHKKMIPLFPDNVPEYFNYNQELREAAVLLCLFQEEDTLKTVLIERVPDAGPHSGQIAFPGGRREISDNDLIDTALRETLEEVGINLSRESFVGSLTPVQIPISRYSVLPVVCVTSEISELIACEDEVKNIFIVDLFELLKTERILPVNARGMMIDAPSFTFEKQIVWGATAMVLKELKELISLYQYR